MSIIERWDFYDVVVANPTPLGNCSACIFRNAPGYCKKMICEHKYNGVSRRVFWTFRHGAVYDIPEPFLNAARRHIDIAAACRQKIAEVYGIKGK